MNNPGTQLAMTGGKLTVGEIAIPYLETRGGFVIKVRVHPRAGRNEIIGLYGDSLKVCVTAPAEAGAANKACLKLLAKWMKLKQNQLTISAGHKSRNKRISIQGIVA